MRRVSSKEEMDILEASGYWRAGAFLSKLTKKLILKHFPLEIGHIKQAHKIIFETAKQPDIAGKYRRDNGPELKRIDGTILPITRWEYIPNEMANLNDELANGTRNLVFPATKSGYRKLILTAVRLSHRLASIHPFYNGNGRTSRLLLNAILLRGGLPEVPIKTTKEQYLRAMRQGDDGDFQLLGNIIERALLKVYKERRKKVGV
jgi:Fic family protein